MAYHLIAQTDAKQHLGDSYQLFVYQDLSSAPGSVVTLDLLTDFVLRRGNANPKNKKEKFLKTEIKFTVLDTNTWLGLLMKDADELDFQGVIKKNGSVYFAGYLSSYLNSYDFTKTNTKLNLLLYDGINLLKNFKDFNQTWATSLTSMADIFYNILKSIYELNVVSYISFYPDGISSPVPIDEFGFNIADLLPKMDKNYSYYDLLNLLLEYDFTLFQENGTWVIRHNGSMVNPVTKCTTTSSSTTSTSINPIVSLSNTDLKISPKKVFIDRIGKMIYSVDTYKKPSTDNEIGWKNGDFVEGNNGWTVEAGTVIFGDGNVKIMSAVASGRISQSPNHLFASGDIINFKLSSMSSIYYKSTDTFTGNYGAFASVKWVDINDSGRIYWLRADGAWYQQTPPNYLNDYLYPLYKPGSVIIEGYGSLVTERDIESTIPGIAGSGYITVYLHGGCDYVQSPAYPYDIPAEHFYCHLLLKETTSDLTNRPTQLIVSSKVDGAITALESSIEFHDTEPYNDICFYEITANSKTVLWDPGNLSLLELLATKIIKFNSSGMMGLDIDLDPSKALTILDLMQYSSKNYLIMYEENKLISKERRFIAFEHVENSPTITTERYYI